MKKFLAIILFMCMLTLSACTNANEDTTSSDDDKQSVASISVSEDEMLYTGTYDRMTNTIAYVSFDGMYDSFKESCINSDITAKVKILAFVTNEVNDFETVFLAEILDVYKGDVSKNDKIFISQDGNTRDFMVRDYPIFNISDTFLLNFKMSKDARVNNHDVFYITDHNCGIIQLYDYKNIEYAINRATPEYLDNFDLMSVEASDKKNILDNLLESDPLLENSRFYEVYRYLDLEEKLKKIVKEE